MGFESDFLTINLFKYFFSFKKYIIMLIIGIYRQNKKLYLGK